MAIWRSFFVAVKKGQPREIQAFTAIKAQIKSSTKKIDYTIEPSRGKRFFKRFRTMTTDYLLLLLLGNTELYYDIQYRRYLLLRIRRSLLQYLQLP